MLRGLRELRGLWLVVAGVSKEHVRSHATEVELVQLTLSPYMSPISLGEEFLRAQQKSSLWTQ